MPTHKRVKVTVEFEVPGTRVDDTFGVDDLKKILTPRAWVKNLSVSAPTITSIKIPTVKNENMRRMNEYKRIIKSIVAAMPNADKVTINGSAYSDRAVVVLNMSPINSKWGQIDVVSCVCKDSTITLEGRYFFYSDEKFVVNLADPNALELLKSGITKNVEAHINKSRSDSGSSSWFRS